MTNKDIPIPAGLTPMRVIVLGAFGILFLQATVFSGNPGEKMQYTDSGSGGMPTTVSIMEQMKHVDSETTNRADANTILLKPPGRTKLTEASIK